MLLFYRYKAYKSNYLSNFFMSTMIEDIFIDSIIFIYDGSIETMDLVIFCDDCYLTVCDYIILKAMVITRHHDIALEPLLM